MKSSTSSMLQLAMMLGVWRVSSSCNTRSSDCMAIMNTAIELKSPDLKCSGMRNYLSCVQDDIADCEGNRFTDQYARNMVSSYCSQAYLCKGKLEACYQGFTTEVMNGIQRADNQTRKNICDKIVTPIMTCMDGVAKQCINQTGLMETVKSRQDNLNSACGDTDPCLGMVYDCQASIMNILPASHLQPDNDNRGHNCSSQTTVDFCGAYRNALTCITSNVSLCSERFKVDNIVATLSNTTTTVCDPEVTCTRKIKTCLCHIKQSSNPTAMIFSICSTFPPFSACLSNLGQECSNNQVVRAEVTSLKADYQKYHRLYCSRDDGLCPPALQCLSKLPQANEPDTFVSSVFDVGKLCSVAGPVFGCLETASGQCDDDNTHVTFTKLEDRFQDMCTHMEPNMEQLTTCDTFMQCITEFDLVQLGLSANTNPEQIANITRTMFVGLSKTQYWCRYLEHGFECVTGSAVSCGLSQQFASQARLKYDDIKTLCAGPVTQPPATNAPNPNGGGVTVRPSRDGSSGGSMARCGHQSSVLFSTLLSLFLARHFLMAS